MEDDFTRVVVLSSRFEADLVKDALEKEGVPHLVLGHEETAYNGIFIPQKGWGALLVPERMKETALSIIEPLLESLARARVPMAEEKRPYRDPGDVDPALWEELSQKDPGEVSRRAGVLHRERGYLLRFLDADYTVLPQQRLIEPADGLNFEFYMVVLNYLIRADGKGLSGRTVTEKELKGGQFFFAGPHELRTGVILERYGTDPEGFIEAGTRLGGVPTGMGDASIRLMPLPRVPLGFILWRADEEFGASVATTFDSSVDRFLPLDCVWSLVTQVALRLAKAG